MNYLSRICPEFCKSPTAYVFLTANLFICFLVSDWDKVIPYLEQINESNCKPVVEKISFGFSCNYGLYLNPADIFKGFFYMISIPSLIATQIFMLDLKTQYSHWCPETFEFIQVFAFIFFNSLYWMILGYLIEIAHPYYKGICSERENPISIFPHTN